MSGFFQCFVILLSLSLSGSLFATDDHFLTEDEFTQAKNLGNSDIKFENYIQSLPPIKDLRHDRHWFTFTEFDFEYPKLDASYHFLVGHSFKHDSQFGHFVLYKDSPDITKICLWGMGDFTDLFQAALIVSSIHYHYVSQTNTHDSYIILGNADAGYQAGGKGYARACLKAFIDQFVIPRTQVKYVFSDLRAGATQHSFPDYGFKSGSVEGYDVCDKLQRPFYLKLER